MTCQRSSWLVLIFANVLAWGVLSFHERSRAAPQEVRAPFDNAVQQRNEMIRELQDIKSLLKEQIALLRAGADKDHAPAKKSRP